MNVNEDSPLLSDQAARQSLVNTDTKENIKVYKRRWYVLGLFCICTFHQAIVWNTFSPLAETMYRVYDWDAGTIALVSAWSPIIVILTQYFFNWLMDVKGLRISCLIGAGSMALGTGIRCITKNPPVFTYLMHIGNVFNAITEVVTIAAPPLLSALWFPAHQRTTATAIASVPAGFGIATSFLLGPAVVPLPQTVDSNATQYDDITDVPTTIIPPNPGNSSDFSATQDRLMYLLYGEFAFAAAIFIMILIYFPSKPPTAPSTSSTTPRTPFLKGLKSLLRNKKYILLGGTYAISNGVFWGWAGVLDVILMPYNISEVQAGWLGFYSTLIGNAMAVPVGIFADILSKRMKLFLLVLYSLSAIGFILFALQCLHIIPVNIVGLNINLVLGSMGVNAGVPLFFELACESAYPVAEGLSNGTIVWLNNIFVLLFQMVLLKPNIGVAWMNWTMIGSVVVCIPVILLFKDTYSRLNIDEQDTKNKAKKVPE